MGVKFSSLITKICLVNKKGKMAITNHSPYNYVWNDICFILLGRKLCMFHTLWLGIPKRTFTRLGQLKLAWQKNSGTNNAHNLILHNSSSMHNCIKTSNIFFVNRHCHLYLTLPVVSLVLIYLILQSNKYSLYLAVVSPVGINFILQSNKYSLYLAVVSPVGINFILKSNKYSLYLAVVSPVGINFILQSNKYSLYLAVASHEGIYLIFCRTEYLLLKESWGGNFYECKECSALNSFATSPIIIEYKLYKFI